MILNPRRPHPPFVPGLLLVVLAQLCLPAPVRASGFSLLEHTGSGIGFAYAGASAAADDASAMFFNPATLTLMKSTQLAVAVHGINLQARFSDLGSTLPAAGLGTLPTGTTRDDSGGLIPVPNLYFTRPLSERFAFGFAINAPFGLVTEYENTWIGRFQGIRSSVVTVNANPALGYQLNDRVSLGLGLNYQHADAEFSNAVLLGPALEGRARIDVEDEAWGWNAGALFMLPAGARIGVSYRSAMHYLLTGPAKVTTLDGTEIGAAGGPTSVNITFPDSVHLSAVQPISAALELRADVNWMNWSKVEALVAINPATGLPRDVLALNFKDTVRVALGAGYKWNEHWSLRAGLAWDPTPVPNEFRTVRLPDNDRRWLTVGARWNFSPQLLIDAGYAHQFLGDTKIDLTRGQTGAPSSFDSHVVGRYDNALDILSVQMSWSFR